jgi:hypothetical protein
LGALELSRLQELGVKTYERLSEMDISNYLIADYITPEEYAGILLYIERNNLEPLQVELTRILKEKDYYPDMEYWLQIKAYFDKAFAPDQCEQCGRNLQVGLLICQNDDCFDKLLGFESLGT